MIQILNNRWSIERKDNQLTIYDEYQGYILDIDIDTLQSLLNMVDLEVNVCPQEDPDQVIDNEWPSSVGPINEPESPRSVPVLISRKSLDIKPLSPFSLTLIHRSKGNGK